MRHFLLTLLLLTARVIADPPAGYYNAATGLTGTPLKTALNGIIKTGHTVILYDDLFAPMKALHQDPANSSNFILIYSGLSIPKSSSTWNREHLWPRSRGNGEHLGPDDSDLFHVMPCDADVNTQRSALYFDTSSAADGGLTNPAHAEAPLCTRDSNSWEPLASQRGDIARTLFYMATRYDGTEPNTQDLELVRSGPSGPQMANLDTLLAWHAADPPDTAELGRNELIFSAYQHNRNPFIDHPEYAAAIWGTGAGNTPIAQATNGVESAIEAPFVAGSFIVRMSPPVTTGTVAVSFTTSGTASGSDYTLSGSGVSWNSATGTGSILFSSGTSAVTVTLSPTSDSTAETLETAQLTLTSGTGYTLTGGPAKLTISDITPSAADGVIALWNFNTEPNATAPRWNSIIAPSAGAGEVRLGGWTGTAGGTSPGTNDAFTGVTGNSLSLVGIGGNGRSLDVVVSTSGWAAMSATLFTRSSSTGYNSATWSWSADGTTFTPIAGINTASQSGSFQQFPLVVDVTAIGALNNLSTFTLRCTFAGATGSTGTARIDDLSILGTRYSQAWLSRFPPLTGTSAARTADLDGDGLNNFAEWAFDRDPFAATGAPATAASAVAAPDPADGNIVKMWPTIRFTRRTDAPQITYVIEYSTDLAAWTVGGTLVATESSGEAGSELAIYRAGIPLAGASVFLRVRATMP